MFIDVEQVPDTEHENARDCDTPEPLSLTKNDVVVDYHKNETENDKFIDRSDADRESFVDVQM